MDNRFPSQGSSGMRPPGSLDPMGLGMPQNFGIPQPNFVPHHPQGGQGWSTQQQQAGGQMNFISAVPSVSGSVSGAPTSRLQPSSQQQQQQGGKDRNYLAQQQKLRAMASSIKKPGPVSADSLIDDLLQKKETFTIKPQVSAAQAAKLAEKHSPMQLQVDTLMQQIPSEIHVPPEMSSEGMAGFGLTSPTGSSALPYWLQPDSINMLPAVYRHVWELSRSVGPDGRELVDTGKIFAVLVTSGLPRDSLGYIWNLANTGIPGVLNRGELNVMLALVALAQTGWRDFSSSAVLAMVQQPPVPNLQIDNFAAPPPAKLAQQPPVQLVEPTPLPQSKDIVSPHQEDLKVLPTISQQVSSGVSAGLLDDDFSDFQAAPPVSTISMPDFGSFVKNTAPRSALGSNRDSPLGFNSFESPPTSPVFSPKPSNGKGSREVGSRLANYSFTAPSSSSGSRKSETDNEDDVFRSDDLFPKCVVKDKSPGEPTTPPFLKETVIRAELGETSKQLFETSKTDSFQKDDDKYSALRDIDFGNLTLDSPPSIAAESSLMPDTSLSAATDDFGDFLSADDSFAQLSSREPPTPAAAAAPQSAALPEFQFEATPQAWSASFEAFPAKSSPPDDDLWKSDEITAEPSSNNDTSLPEISVDDEDFGDFVGPTTTNTNASAATLPSILKIKETSNITPDTQSLASLDLGGFDTLSLGGAGPSSSPDGGGGGLLDLKIDETVSWDSQPPALNHHDEGMEWKQCLHSCINLLQAAAQIFLAIEDQSVVDEVVNSKQGEDYLANLLEVYCVTQRINAASRKLLPSSRHLLEPLLCEVENVWSTLRPFLEQSSLEVKDRNWNVPQENSSSCSLCLTQVEDSEVGSLALVKSGPNSYHAACANLWLNCINAQLPAILVP